MTTKSTPPAATGRGNGAMPLPPPSAAAASDGEAAPKKWSPFDDMKALRASNKAAFGGENEGPLSVTLGRPKKELYVRFRDDDDYLLPSQCWSETDDSRVLYYVTNNLWDLEDLQGGLRAVILAAWLGCDGTTGVWAAPGSSIAGSWYDSGQEILAIGRKGWVRIQTHNKEKRYLHFLPVNPVPDRDWPDISFGDMLKKAFGSRVVDSAEHELIRKLRNA